MDRQAIAATAPRFGAIAPILLALLLLAALLVGTTRPSTNPAGSLALGCDSFGYQRGAELFRKRGILGGLRTAIPSPEARELIAAAKDTGLPPASWAQAIAPHCHHYDRHADAVILQYPPGTSLMMALFSRGTGGQNSFTAAVGLLCGALAVVCLRARPGFAGLLALAFLAEETIGLLMLPSTFASYSVPWTVALVPPVVLVALAMAEVGPRLSALLALALGLGCALLLLIRIPNLFLAGGIGLLMLLRCRAWTAAGRAAHGRALAVAAVVFVVFGPGLLGLYQALNTGSPLRTTYAPEDASGIVLSWELMRTNAAYYFATADAARFVDIGFVTLLLSCAFGTTRRPDPRGTAARVAGLAVAGVSIAFFLTHAITAPYYLVPAACFSLVLVVFAELSVVPASSATRWTVPAALAGFAALTAACLLWRSEKPPFPMQIPAEVLAPDAIVWADALSGTLLYYNGKFAAKLGFADGCTRSKLIAAVAHRHHPQYIIEDTPVMVQMVERLSKLGPISAVGTYDVYEPVPVVRLDGDWSGLRACVG